MKLIILDRDGVINYDSDAYIKSPDEWLPIPQSLEAIATLKQRKFVVGMQDVKEGLITSGFYRYFRHPIYTGMIWVYLGLPLVMRNPDGLLMFPAIFVIVFAVTIIEERNDMCVRFREQYQAYRQTTRMFGPIWLWGALVLFLSVLIAVGSP